MIATFQTDGGKVISWASLLDDQTRLQAEMISRSPIIAGHVALMPDAHLGMGATVGCVLPQRGGIIPSAVGVDIGCGMVSVHTDARREQLSEAQCRAILGAIRERIPSGVGKNHEQPTDSAHHFLAGHYQSPGLTPVLRNLALHQFGTLGAGNHFVELSEDLDGDVWITVHSGSRGIGNQLAMKHIKVAVAYCQGQGLDVEHKDLSYLVENTLPFDEYIADMLWAQRYAWAQRQEMIYQAEKAIETQTDFFVIETVHCHHNYSEKQPDGTWLSRKGAINAEIGTMGIIPGSMGAETHIVEGLGNPESYCSAPHGAGRLLSRGGAKRTLDIEEFRNQMAGITWDDRNAQDLLDEAPFAYKPIGQVMEDAKDLVRTRTILKQFINYKGL